MLDERKHTQQHAASSSNNGADEAAAAAAGVAESEEAAVLTVSEEGNHRTGAQSQVWSSPRPPSPTNASHIRLPVPLPVLPMSSAPSPADQANASSSRMPASSDPATNLTPDLFLPLLNCPLCDPPGLLTSPITLRCGHTVCLSHVTEPPEPPSSSFVSDLLTSIASTSKRKLPLPPCPIPTCPSVNSPSDNATAEQLPRHPLSRVNYLPPPPLPYLPQQDNHPEEKPLPLRVDVTLNKVMNLVTLSQPWFLDNAAPSRRNTLPFPEDDEHTDSEPEEDTEGDDTPDPGRHSDLDRRPSFASVPDASLPNRASRRPRPHSRSPSRRPRKRPRRTRQQPAHDRPTVAAEPPLSASARFEKELLAELTCQICFGLLWQPVTTPCQHVRSSLSCSRPPYQVLPTSFCHLLFFLF